MHTASTKPKSAVNLRFKVTRKLGKKGVRHKYVIRTKDMRIKSSLFYRTLKVRRKESVKRPFGHLSQLHL